MNQIVLIKLLDKIIGYPLSSLLPRIRKHRKNTPEKFDTILIIRPGGIGDTVLLLPILKALRDKFIDIQIDVLCEKRNAEIFSLSKEINRIYLYDKISSLIQCLGNKYDIVIDTEQWHRLSAIVAHLTQAPIRIGFDTNDRRRLFTHRITYSHDDYEVYSFLHLIEPLTGKIPDFITDEAFIDVHTHSSELPLLSSLKDTDRLVSIFPGASIRERRWGGERFGKVAEAVSNKGYTIVILGSPDDREDAEKIKEYAGHCIDLTGKTNLGDVALVLRKSRLLFSADSGIMHIAFAVGTPTISLFGSGIEKKWAPQGKKNIILNKHLSCSPCTTFGYTPRCKKNVECLTSIGVDEVINAVDIILNED